MNYLVQGFEESSECPEFDLKYALWKGSFHIFYSIYNDIYIHGIKNRCETDRNESILLKYISSP